MNGALDELPIEVQQGGIVTRYAEWGDMAVRFARVPAGTDMGPVLEGLPGGRMRVRAYAPPSLTMLWAWRASPPVYSSYTQTEVSSAVSVLMA